MRFPAIEGLRGWLAWAVVACHTAYWSGADGKIGRLIRDLGTPAVMTFIVISGFCITHLLLERREPYAIYLARRFFRLFPAFAVNCLLGYFVYHLQLQLPDLNFDPKFVAYLGNVVAAMDDYLPFQIAAHATLMHGVIPNAWLPYGDEAFNAPAWSVSLEWQFYLIAPLLVTALIKRPKLAPLLAALFAIAYKLTFWSGLVYNSPCFLLAASPYFAIGIASRLLHPVFSGKIKNQYIPLACIIMLYAVTQAQAALSIWAVVYMGLIAPPSRLYRSMLESPIAIYLGSRSYSTYLGHFLVVVVCQHFAAKWLGQVPQLLPFAAMVIPATLVSSELLYRAVELPGIRLGSWLCRKLQPEKLVALKKVA
jgi:peptidoglycan/LPS O-acetylase OafA/YrhL